MALGRKTGGRQKGTPNKITREIAAQLSELKVNPLVGMVQLAENPATPVGIRAHLYAELLEYIHSKRVRVQVVGAPGDDGSDGPIRVVYENKPYADDPAPIPPSSTDRGNRAA